MIQSIRFTVLPLVAVSLLMSASSFASYRCWKVGVGGYRVVCEKGKTVNKDTQTLAAQYCISEAAACCAAEGKVETMKIDVEDLSGRAGNAFMPCPKSTGGSRR